MEKKISLILAGVLFGVIAVLAQTQVVGTVVSAVDKEPIIGASVQIVGEKTWAITDVNGKFSLVVPAQYKKLQVSYLGMITKTVNVQPMVNVELMPNDQMLDEVLVTGYGNFKKSSFTGSASTLKTSELKDVPVLSVEKQLAGGIAGVNITSTSGSPGAVSSVRIRGMGSINAGNEPLYVIDGTPVMSGDVSEFTYSNTGTSILASINPSDIESITVIKDAAAASLYGSRAANGVIVITTKSGSKGRTKVEFRSDWGFSNMAVNYRPSLNGDDRRALLHLGLKNYALYNLGNTEANAIAYADSEIDNYASKPSLGWTDWRKLLIKNGSHQNYQVAVSGGSDNTQFHTSIAYTNQKGIAATGEGLERFTGNLGLSHTFGRFIADISSNFSKTNQDLTMTGVSYDAPIANAVLFQNPSTVPYNEDGSLASSINGAMISDNPLYEGLHTYLTSNLSRALNSAKLTFNVIKGLNVSEKITYDLINATQDSLWDKYSGNGGPGGVMQRTLSKISQLNSQLQVSYIKSFGNHHFDVLAGFETENYRYSYNYLHGNDYPGEQYEFANATTTTSSSSKSASKLESYLARANYDWNNRYYFSTSFRRDGSSRLASSNRWATFYSFSGAWRISEEDFYKSVKDVLTDAKIRVSYGTNGTQPSSFYGYMNLYRYGQFYNGSSGMATLGVANPDLKWEKNRALNLGVDLTFIDRISVTFDWYTRKTTDLIYDMPVSYTTGYLDTSTNEPTMPTNIGSLRNRGWELTITSENYTAKDFTWSTSLNMSHNSNKVLALNGTDNVIMDSDWSNILAHKVGEVYNSYYGYEYAGVDRATGAELYYKNDGTRETTTNVNEANRVILGSAQATVQGGITNNIRYKFIDLGFTFTYQIGGDAYDHSSWQHTNGSSQLYRAQIPTYYKIEDTWTAGNPDAKLPKFQYGSTQIHSSRWMMPLDYLRLKNLTLGFNVPVNFISKLGLSKARIYFSGSNILTWKSSKLYVDPELRANGIAYIDNPQLRTYTFGIEIGF